MGGKRPPLDEERALFEATVAAEGVTTSAGEGTGLSLVDAGLAGAGANSFVSMMAVIYPGDPQKVDSKDITAFNDGTGGVTVASAFKGGQVAAGVPYKIVTFRFVPAEVAAIEAKVDAITAKIGTPTDNADLATLFAKAYKVVLPTHAHVLLAVHDTANLDADLDEALRDWMLDLGYEVTVADPADVAANLDVDAFDFIVISGSCLVGDAGNLANLRTADAPLLCHSAAIAESALFLGATAGSEAAQTQIEIINNSPAWLIEQATGDLTVTISATIQTLATEAANAIVLGEEATATGIDLTIIKLPQGEQDDGAPSYSSFYDRYFNGVADYTNANAVWKALMAGFLHHMLHEKRFGEGTVQLKRVPQEHIPDSDFDLDTIDDGLTVDPPSADVANSIVDLDERVNLAYVLRSLWVDVTNFGTTAGTKLTFSLWTLVKGVVTEVDSVEVSDLGIQNLMDLFGLQEVHADGIWVTVVTDATDEPGDAACEGSYRYAEARK